MVLLFYCYYFIFPSILFFSSQFSGSGRLLPRYPLSCAFSSCCLQIDDTGTFQVVVVPPAADYTATLQRLQRCTFCYGKTYREVMIWARLLSVLSHHWQKQLELGNRDVCGRAGPRHTASSTAGASQRGPQGLCPSRRGAVQASALSATSGKW